MTNIKLYLYGGIGAIVLVLLIGNVFQYKKITQLNKDIATIGISLENSLINNRALQASIAVQNLAVDAYGAETVRLQESLDATTVAVAALRKKTSERIVDVFNQPTESDACVAFDHLYTTVGEEARTW